MTARLSRAILTSAEVAADADAGSPAIPVQTYCIETTLGLYNTAMSVLGITSETADTDYSEFPLLTIKEAVRAGLIKGVQVEITMPDNSSYRRNLLYSTSVDAAPDNVVGVTWPVGKPAGGKITDIKTPSRIKSRV